MKLSSIDIMSMVNYEYLKQIKQMANIAIIDFLSNFIHATYFRFKNGDVRSTERSEYCCQKSIIRLNRLSKQLFSCYE